MFRSFEANSGAIQRKGSEDLAKSTAPTVDQSNLGQAPDIDPTIVLKLDLACPENRQRPYPAPPCRCSKDSTQRPLHTLMNKTFPQANGQTGPLTLEGASCSKGDF